ncbi:MAG: hypothetical protein ACOYJD_05355 [Christensenellales bacterium]|jgi:hypothetical protein
MDLRSYAKAQRSGENQPQAAPPDEQQIKETISMYSGKTQEELFDELTRVTKEQKESGALDDGQIKQMADKISAMLSPEQREKLDEVMNRLINN